MFPGGGREKYSEPPPGPYPNPKRRPQEHHAGLNSITEFSSLPFVEVIQASSMCCVMRSGSCVPHSGGAVGWGKCLQAKLLSGRRRCHNLDFSSDGGGEVAPPTTPDPTFAVRTPDGWGICGGCSPLGTNRAKPASLSQSRQGYPHRRSRLKRRSRRIRRNRKN